MGASSGKKFGGGDQLSSAESLTPIDTDTHSRHRRSCPPSPPVRALLFLSAYARPRKSYKMWRSTQSTYGRSAVLCRKAEGEAYRISVTPDKAEVSQTIGIGAWVVTNMRCTLVRCSRARHSRDPPPDSVMEERSHWNQPNPSRNPRSPSGLFGYTQERSKHNRVDPRVPDLEAGIHVPVFFVDRPCLCGRGQN